MALPSSILKRSTRALQPAATAVAAGTIYYVTDENITEQSDGANWLTYADDGAGVYNAGNTGTALTINWANGGKQRCTLTGNVTFTLSNPVDGKRYILFLQTGAGGFTGTWPASVLWSGGTAPTITATGSKVDIIVLAYLAATSKYYGVFTQNF